MEQGLKVPILEEECWTVRIQQPKVSVAFQFNADPCL